MLQEQLLALFILIFIAMLGYIIGRNISKTKDKEDLQEIATFLYNLEPRDEKEQIMIAYHYNKLLEYMSR